MSHLPVEHPPGEPGPHPMKFDKSASHAEAVEGFDDAPGTSLSLSDGRRGQTGAASGFGASSSKANAVVARERCAVGPGLLGPRFPDIAHHTTASFLTLPSILALHATSPLLLNAYSHEVTALRIHDPRPSREIEDGSLNRYVYRVVSSLLHRFTLLRELQVPLRGYVRAALMYHLHEHGHATLASLTTTRGKAQPDPDDWGHLILRPLVSSSCSALLPCLTSITLHSPHTNFGGLAYAYGGLLSCCPRLTELKLSGSIVEPVVRALAQHPPPCLTRLTMRTPPFRDVKLLHTSLPRTLQHLRISSPCLALLDVLARWLFESKAPQLLRLEFKTRSVWGCKGYVRMVGYANALVDALCSPAVAPSLQYLDLVDLSISNDQRRRLRETKAGGESGRVMLLIGEDSDDESDGYFDFSEDGWNLESLSTEDFDSD